MLDGHLNSADVPDERLLTLVGRGDYAAFTELYGRYERPAYALACRVARDRSLAEDVVVEAMLAVWHNGAKFEAARGSARAWILTIVHRRAVDAVRAEARRRRVPEGIKTEFETVPAAEDVAVLTEERTSVQRALSQLPERERELLELAYYGGLTQSELARTLGISLGTVKSRMFTGLGRMRSLLGDAREPALELEIA